jgi:hypothetical protein
MTGMTAPPAYWRRFGRALIVGGLGCTLAGVAGFVFAPAGLSGTRIAFSAVFLAYGVGSAVTGIILRRRHRMTPESGDGTGPPGPGPG